jgi:hypothetical protein
MKKGSRCPLISLLSGLFEIHYAKFLKNEKRKNNKINKKQMECRLKNEEKSKIENALKYHRKCP